MGSAQADLLHIAHLTTPTQGDFWILKMSFGFCSKNSAKNRFWSLSAWGAGAAFQFCAGGSAFTDGLLSAPPLCAPTPVPNIFNTFVISKRWVARAVSVVSARFRTIQICPKDLSLRLTAQSSARWSS